MRSTKPLAEGDLESTVIDMYNLLMNEEFLIHDLVREIGFIGSETDHSTIRRIIRLYPDDFKRRGKFGNYISLSTQGTKRLIEWWAHEFLLEEQASTSDLVIMFKNEIDFKIKKDQLRSILEESDVIHRVNGKWLPISLISYSLEDVKYDLYEAIGGNARTPEELLEDLNETYPGLTRIQLIVFLNALPDVKNYDGKWAKFAKPKYDSLELIDKVIEKLTGKSLSTTTLRLSLPTKYLEITDDDLEHEIRQCDGIICADGKWQLSLDHYDKLLHPLFSQYIGDDIRSEREIIDHIRQIDQKIPKAIIRNSLKRNGNLYSPERGKWTHAGNLSEDIKQLVYKKLVGPKAKTQRVLLYVKQTFPSLKETQLEAILTADETFFQKPGGKWDTTDEQKDKVLKPAISEILKDGGLKTYDLRDKLKSNGYPVIIEELKASLKRNPEFHKLPGEYWAIELEHDYEAIEAHLRHYLKKRSGPITKLHAHIVGLGYSLLQNQVVEVLEKMDGIELYNNHWRRIRPEPEPKRGPPKKRTKPKPELYKPTRQELEDGIRETLSVSKRKHNGLLKSLKKSGLEVSPQRLNETIGAMPDVSQSPHGFLLLDKPKPIKINTNICTTPRVRRVESKPAYVPLTSFRFDDEKRIEQLAKAVRQAYYDPTLGEENMSYEVAEETAKFVLNFFGYADRIIDNILDEALSQYNPQLGTWSKTQTNCRDIFYDLENRGILTRFEEDAIIFHKDSKGNFYPQDGWRVCYWAFKLERIEQLLNDYEKRRSYQEEHKPEERCPYQDIFASEEFERAAAARRQANCEDLNILSDNS